MSSKRDDHVKKIRAKEKEYEQISSESKKFQGKGPLTNMCKLENEYTLIEVKECIEKKEKCEKELAALRSQLREISND